MTDPKPAVWTMKVGETRELELPGLGTAGYRWDEDVQVADPDAVSPVETSWVRGVPPGVAISRPAGASFPEVLTVAARAVGEVTITLRQSRPWETGAEPVATRTIVVRVG